MSKFSPSIIVFKNREDYESLKSETLEQIALDAIDGWTGLLKDYALIEPPSRCEISRCPSIRFKSRLVFEHRNIQPILIDDETLVIDQRSLHYTIHLYDSPSTGDATPKEFARFIESLHIV